MAEHLYIHIPYCNYICTYCDFKRTLINGQNYNSYITKVIAELKGPYKSVYIGGGTPNALPDDELNRLLAAIKNHLQEEYEFTIEANPDSVTINQVKILKQNGVNRISLGVQTTNNEILFLLNRKHSTQQVENAITLLQENDLTNISLDFIYNLPFLKNLDIENSIELLNKFDIKHVSFYALELKEGSVMTKKGEVVIDTEKEEDQLLFIDDLLTKSGFERYEVSNWCKNKMQSIHNKAYWLSNDWQGIGYGAGGFENKFLYNVAGNVNNWKIEGEKLDLKNYYFQILMMGLRLKEGLNLENQKYKEAYNFYKEKLKNVEIVNNYLKCKDINILGSTLIELL